MTGQMSDGVKATLAIFALMLLAPNSWAVGHEKVLYSFNQFKSKGGYAANSALIFDAAGNLYGTTYFGGSESCPGDSNGCGTVFELTPQKGGLWREKVLHTFRNKGDGYLPVANLIFDATGNLYGTTTQGGVYNDGTVFELTSNEDGSWREKVLHSFNHNGRDGAVPAAGLILDAVGNLYGTTAYGGRETCPGSYNGCGTVFELMPKTAGAGGRRCCIASATKVTGTCPKLA